MDDGRCVGFRRELLTLVTLEGFTLLLYSPVHKAGKKRPRGLPKIMNSRGLILLLRRPVLGFYRLIPQRLYSKGVNPSGVYA